MTMVHDLPVEFAEFSGKVSFIRRKSPNEFSSTCPQCGGRVHDDGELPDRLTMVLRSETTGGPFAFCRRCKFKWWSGKKTGKEIDPLVLEELERQWQAAEAARAAARTQQLARFTTSELWDELHSRLQGEQRDWWTSQGIPEDWQDYLKLGYQQSYTYHVGEEQVTSPAYTIPYFHTGWKFMTMQYRLSNVTRPKDRYRFAYALGTSYYQVVPTEIVKPVVIITEGAKKAIVGEVYAGGVLDDTATFLAIPSASDWRRCGILEAVKDCERVYIALDPDCWREPDKAPVGWEPQPVKFAREIGKAARLVELAVKLDDGFVQHGMEVGAFESALKMARRL